VLQTLSAGHWEVLRNIRLRALADSPDAFGGTLAQSLGQPESFWRGRAGGEGPTVVVLAGDAAVAMGGVHLPASGRAAVWGMWTDPQARGRGLGGQVLDHLLTWCRERALVVELQVVEGNPVARRLYTGRGFRPTGQRELLREGSSTYAEVLVLDTSTSGEGLGRQQ
jgi:GNAT superfamily N-acetyltransferase